MTTVDIVFRYGTPPSEAVAVGACGRARGLRHPSLNFDRAAQTVRVEYDATRLNAAAVTQLVRQAGLDIDEEAAVDSAAAGTGAGPGGLIQTIARRRSGILDNLTEGSAIGSPVCARSSAG